MDKTILNVVEMCSGMQRVGCTFLSCLAKGNRI